MTRPKPVRVSNSFPLLGIEHGRVHHTHQSGHSQIISHSFVKVPREGVWIESHLLF